MFQLQNLAFNLGLGILRIFICAALADISSLFRLMNIVGDLFAPHCAQVFQAFLLFRKALGCQTINFALRICITLSTNTHCKTPPGCEARVSLASSRYTPYMAVFLLLLH